MVDTGVVNRGNWSGIDEVGMVVRNYVAVVGCGLWHIVGDSSHSGLCNTESVQVSWTVVAVLAVGVVWVFVFPIDVRGIASYLCVEATHVGPWSRSANIRGSEIMVFHFSGGGGGNCVGRCF